MEKSKNNGQVYLILPVGQKGIPGSGKSRLYDTSINKDTVLVCPDDIRREVNGNVSDQRNGAKVFKIAYERTISALASGKDVYFSATNLVSVNTMDLLKAIKDAIPDKDLNVTFYVLSDSFKPELCYERIAKDISNGVDRSNVPKDVVMKMYQKFKSMIDNLDKGVLKNFMEENDIYYTVNYV